jgi:hypothetical protein
MLILIYIYGLTARVNFIQSKYADSLKRDRLLVIVMKRCLFAESQTEKLKYCFAEMRWRHFTARIFYNESMQASLVQSYEVLE